MTLIELLIVLAIMIVFMGAASASFTNMLQHRNPELFMKDLAAYVRYLQYKSVETGKIGMLRPASGEGGLETYEQNSRREFKKISEAAARRFEAEKKFLFRWDQPGEIYFYPDGSVTRGRLSVFAGQDPVAVLVLQNRLGVQKVEMHG